MPFLNEMENAAVTTSNPNPIKPSRREFERTELRTAATTIYRDSKGCLQALRSWIDNISPVGVRLITETQLSVEQIYIRVMMEGLADKVVVGKIVQQYPPRIRTLGLKEKCYYQYGIKLDGVCESTEVLELAGIAVPMA
ncbi:hypothetical protein [Aureliella helgolandensis]|uniref:PilZ domain-containing protein n=1 Tax=Aureliella helgolandensis TaxID=2527968 RepID=A0A518GCG0_9BACT|nr:hypothetical protein [Aureliella helgolandensis]QDV26284.1 hypothetical protein Q31a_46560 [Aureliella helgolandensis]